MKLLRFAVLVLLLVQVHANPNGTEEDNEDDAGEKLKRTCFNWPFDFTGDVVSINSRVKKANYKKVIAPTPSNNETVSYLFLKRKQVSIPDFS